VDCLSVRSACRCLRAQRRLRPADCSVLQLLRRANAVRCRRRTTSCSGVHRRIAANDCRDWVSRFAHGACYRAIAALRSTARLVYARARWRNE
jgi:hypothetical protein